MSVFCSLTLEEKGESIGRTKKQFFSRSHILFALHIAHSLPAQGMGHCNVHHLPASGSAFGSSVNLFAQRGKVGRSK